MRRTREPIVPPLPDTKVVDLGDRGHLSVRFSPGPTDRRKARRIPPLILIHGWTVTANLNWFGLYEHLAERHTFAAWDQRGHGTGLRGRPFTLEDCADDVVAVADALGWEQFVPVGYSMGGTIAQLVAHRHPDRVAGLVLCSTASVFSETRGDQFFFESILGTAVRALNAAPRFLVDRLPGRFRSPDKTSPLAAWMATEYEPHHAGMIAEAGHAVGRFRSDDWLPDITVPAAVVLTLDDATVPASRQRQLVSLLPNATVHPVGLDHRAAATNPEEYWPVLDAALLSVARRQRPAMKSTLAAAAARDSVHHLFVSGRVQGVGFRDSMQRRAEELGVKGWVRNRRDGRVEAVVEGARDRVDELLDWARTGPPLANVTSFAAKARTVTEFRRARATDQDLEEGFRIRETE